MAYLSRSVAETLAPMAVGMVEVVGLASPHRDFRLRGPPSAAEEEVGSELDEEEKGASRLMPMLAATAAAAARAASRGLDADEDEEGPE